FLTATPFTAAGFAPSDRPFAGRCGRIQVLGPQPVSSPRSRSTRATIQSLSWFSAPRRQPVDLCYRPSFYSRECEEAHTSRSVLLSKIRLIDRAPGGRHGTETRYARICPRDGSCDGGDHPIDQDLDA